MTDLVRQEVATAAHTIVVKVGTRVLTGAGGLLNGERIAALTEEWDPLESTCRHASLSIL